MTKIATKGKCNLIESGGMSSGSFLGDLISECPTYKEITEIGKFNVTGTYEDNQLVKESDITKYTGKTKNYSFIWGEWDLTPRPGQINVNGTINLNLCFKQNFLYAPDTDLKILINYSLFTEGNPSTGTPPSVNPKTLTVNFSQTTSGDKKYAYTQKHSITINTMFETIRITSVVITPLLATSTSQYEYITNIKDVTQNYFINHFSVANTGFYIDSYNDDTTNKIMSNKCRITPIFDIPTGTGVNNIDISVAEFNYSGGSSLGTTYNPNYNSATYTFTVDDYYGERGYKLPYFYTKFVFQQTNTSYLSYAYALWVPNTTNTGIELTSLILEE